MILPGKRELQVYFLWLGRRRTPGAEPDEATCARIAEEIGACDAKVVKFFIASVEGKIEKNRVIETLLRGNDRIGAAEVEVRGSVPRGNTLIRSFESEGGFRAMLKMSREELIHRAGRTRHVSPGTVKAVEKIITRKEYGLRFGMTEAELR